jgi:hypothetical protein
VHSTWRAPPCTAAIEFARIVWCGKTDRVGQIDRGGADGNDGLDDTTEEIDIASSGVLSRKLHVIGVLTRKTDRVDGRLEALVATDAELRLQVKV